MREGTAVAGRYRLVERVGAGGMGEVWRAVDEVLGRTVAVKLVLPSLHTDPDFARRFLAEARAMASVHHPGVVAIHDFGETRHHGVDRVAYLVMEYVAGEPLSSVLARVGRLSAATTMDLVSQTAQALQAVHNHGIVHRDVKPANLLVRPDGSIALTDFGIALGADAMALTQPGTVLGTPSYISPEQVQGQPASARSDVYALGLVAYECLAGRRPFVGEDPFGAALQRVHHAPPALPADVPPRIAGVVSQALAADPARRWQTAAEFALAAQRAVDGGQPVATPHHPGLQARRRRLRIVAPIAAAVVLLAAGVVAFWATRAPAVPEGSGQPGASASPAPSAPVGFVACGQALCPRAPMCWSGLVQQGDRPYAPRSEDCDTPHYWETFAVVYVPDDVTTDRDLSNLMERADIRAACSATVMAQRSRDPANTKGWDRDAWPIPVDASTLLVHCLAKSPDGESQGSVFKSS
jgi:serine/threonine-protein kinase